MTKRKGTTEQNTAVAERPPDQKVSIKDLIDSPTVIDCRPYAEKLKSPLWQRKRLEIMQRDEWKCQICGDNETQLHTHHKIYIKGLAPWEYDNDKLITLCEHCHRVYEGIKEFYFVKDIGIEYFQGYKIHHSTGEISLVLSISNYMSLASFDEKGLFTKCTFFDSRHVPGIMALCQKAVNHGKEVH